MIPLLALEYMKHPAINCRMFERHLTVLDCSRAAGSKREIGSAGMFDKYEVNGLFDEMFATSGVPRAHYRPVAQRLRDLGATAFARRVRMADVTFRNQGITFTVYNDNRGVEKIFPFDLIPRIVPANEWDIIERGLVQRISALNHVSQ